jgi:hypothetical protein
MSLLLLILGLPATLGVLVLKALAVDQVKGQIQRRITAILDATIASLTPELAAEWGDEWRAELAAVISMPITAARYAWGVRRTAREFIAAPTVVSIRFRSLARRIDTVRAFVSIGVVSLARRIGRFALGVSFVVLILGGWGILMGSLVGVLALVGLDHIFVGMVVYVVVTLGLTVAVTYLRAAVRSRARRAAP